MAVCWKKMFDSMWRREGNSFIQFLLDAGLDVNALNKYNTTMLSYAAESGNMEIVEFLIQKGADINVKNGNGSTPLHIAAEYGQTEMVKFFISSNQFVDIRDDSGNTPLHYVADLPYMEAPMQFPVVPYMEWSTRASYREIVHCLLNSNADLDAVNEYGDTPLLLAARKENHEIVRHFIELGANVHCKDQYDRTLLHYCCQNGWESIVRCLLKENIDIDLDSPASVYWSNQFDTPLTIAGFRRHKHIVELLVQGGANVNLECIGGHTLLHLACRWGWADTVKYLVEAGCDVNKTAKDRYTPLLSVVCGLAEGLLEFELSKYLIDNGADVDCWLRTNKEYLLHIACKRGLLDLVKLLIKKECDLNVQDLPYENTPLHVAVMFHELEVVEHLLEAGADYNLQNINDESAFHLLLKSPICLEGIAFFLESGACIQSKDYIVISENPLLKEGILKDLKLCTQAIINKMNVNELNADLLKIYEIPGVSKGLPPFKPLIRIKNTNADHDIQQSVRYKIQSKEYCNVMEVRPINLAILSVKSLIKYYC